MIDVHFSSYPAFQVSEVPSEQDGWDRTLYVNNFRGRPQHRLPKLSQVPLPTPTLTPKTKSTSIADPNVDSQN